MGEKFDKFKEDIKEKSKYKLGIIGGLGVAVGNIGASSFGMSMDVITHAVGMGLVTTTGFLALDTIGIAIEGILPEKMTYEEEPEEELTLEEKVDSIQKELRELTGVVKDMSIKFDNTSNLEVKLTDSEKQL